MSKLCVHWIRGDNGGMTTVDQCSEANEPTYNWNGNSEVIKVSKMADTFWVDEYFPDGTWRIVQKGSAFLHNTCYGQFEMINEDTGKEWVYRHKCNKCRAIVDFEVC